MNRSPVVLIGVDRRSVGSDNVHPAPLARIARGSIHQASRWRLLTPSRSLDFHLSSDYHYCSKCFFPVSPHRL